MAGPQMPSGATIGMTRAHPLQKRAPSELPIHEDVRKRWSPRAFSDEVVSDADLRLLLEAARWAPSSYNEQPWRFIVASKRHPRRFAAMLACLNRKNREWASHAPVLMLTVARTELSHDGSENRHAFHDVGLAMGNLLVQATAINLYVHQMAGIDPDHARRTYGVPDEFEVVAGVAIGYVGDPASLADEKRREAETRRRSRRPLSETVFVESWGRPWSRP